MKERFLGNIPRGPCRDSSEDFFLHSLPTTSRFLSLIVVTSGWTVCLYSAGVATSTSKQEASNVAAHFNKIFQDCIGLMTASPVQ